MCGIGGYSLVRPEALEASVLLAMNRAIAHRGPDDEGFSLIGPERAVRSYSTAESARGVALPLFEPETRHTHRIGLSHRRFSIIDLSSAGHQPFWTLDERLGCVFNGEIYNYVELRDELARSGVAFRTKSDTEVLLEAFRAWGERCFERFSGFWAVALYDANRGKVLLSRDRIGKAPLYVARNTRGLFWCSEIKGLRAALGREQFRVSGQAVLDYVKHGYRDVDDTTFFEGVSTFPRGSFAWVENDGSYFPTPYWDLPSRRLRERDITPDEAARGLRNRLEESLRIRLRADVPMGFELSGGLDSSSLVSLAANRGFSLTAFTVEFPEPEANEERFARQVAERYPAHIDYQVLKPPVEEFFEHADRYVALLDEPFHSPNLQTNQGVWRAMASRNIRVSINGAAADELLAGYVVDYIEPYFRYLLKRGHVVTSTRELMLGLEKIDRGAPAMVARAAGHAVLSPLVAAMRARLPRAQRSGDPFIVPAGAHDRRGAPRDLAGRLRADMGSYRMNYWLRSGNTSYMGVPVEVRAPFLDHNVIEFGSQLPLSYLIRDGWYKWVLRKAAADVLPEDITWRRRKLGFPFPLQSWLRANQGAFWRAVGQLDCRIFRPLAYGTSTNR